MINFENAKPRNFGEYEEWSPGQKRKEQETATEYNAVDFEHPAPELEAQDNEVSESELERREELERDAGVYVSQQYQETRERLEREQKDEPYYEVGDEVYEAQSGDTADGMMCMVTTELKAAREVLGTITENVKEKTTAGTLTAEDKYQERAAMVLFSIVSDWSKFGKANAGAQHSHPHMYAALRGGLPSAATELYERANTLVETDGADNRFDQ